ncbi:unnamed protein product [Chrysoparadoxa australica]
MNWYMGNIHVMAKESLPDALIVDDFDALVRKSATSMPGGKGDEASVAAVMHSLALLEDAARFCSAVKGSMLILVGVSSAEEGMLLRLRRYFPLVMRVEQTRSDHYSLAVDATMSDAFSSPSKQRMGDPLLFNHCARAFLVRAASAPSPSVALDRG